MPSITDSEEIFEADVIRSEGSMALANLQCTKAHTSQDGQDILVVSLFPAKGSAKVCLPQGDYILKVKGDNGQYIASFSFAADLDEEHDIMGLTFKKDNVSE